VPPQQPQDLDLEHSSSSGLHHGVSGKRARATLVNELLQSSGPGAQARLKVPFPPPAPELRRDQVDQTMVIVNRSEPSNRPAQPRSNPATSTTGPSIPIRQVLPPP